MLERLKTHLIVIAALSGVALIATAIPANAAWQRIDDGTYVVDFHSIDDLLGLNPASDVRILVLEDKSPKLLSDAHLSLTRTWVEAGGVLWVEGDGLENALARRVAPFNVSSFSYKKTSTGKQAGELVVAGASPRLVIADHPLTEGVKQLYLFVRHKFDGTLNAIPLVEMTDTAGNHGLVLAAIPVGRGFLVLDGTARSNRFLFGRLKGFDPDHPNSLKQNGTWISYDWNRLRQNARAYAQATLVPTPEEAAVR